MAAIGLLAVPAGARASDDVYTVPGNIQAYARGDLVASEPTSFDPSISQGVGAVYRYMYRSTGALDKAVGETAVVAVPTGQAPPGGWPVVVWAHGTSGIGDTCAPSRSGTLWPGGWNGSSYGTWVENRVKEGYVVVAPDYEGLGTEGLHTYLNVDSEARAIVDAVAAARVLVSETSGDFAVVGHSQGSAAALRVGEVGVPHKKNYAGMNLVGVVGVATGDVATIADNLAATSPYGDYVAAGIAAVDPGFDPADMLGPKGLAKYQDALVQCYDQYFGEFLAPGEKLGPDDIVKPAFFESPTWTSYIRGAESGYAVSTVPALVVHGTGDEVLTDESFDTLFDRMCAVGSTTDRLVHSGWGHDQSLWGSQTDVSDWLGERFAGVPATSACP